MFSTYQKFSPTALQLILHCRNQRYATIDLLFITADYSPYFRISYKYMKHKIYVPVSVSIAQYDGFDILILWDIYFSVINQPFILGINHICS